MNEYVNECVIEIPKPKSRKKSKGCKVQGDKYYFNVKTSILLTRAVHEDSLQQTALARWKNYIYNLQL